MGGIGGPDQTRLAMAGLAACFARTLGEQDSSFEPRLREQIQHMQSRLSELGEDYAGTVETLHWVEEFLRKT